MLDRIFNLDNPVLRFIGKIVDAIVLNFIWMICCIPVITFGPATTALYYALMRDVMDEEAHFVRAFFRSFKQNFKQGTVLGLIAIGVGAMFGAAAYAYGFMDKSQNFWNIMKGATLISLVVYAFIMQYVFAILANFHTTIFKAIQSAFYLSIRNVGWTLLMIFFMAVPFALVIINFFNFLPVMLLGVGTVVYVDSYFLNRILKPWFDEARGDDNPDPDSWTMPDEVPESLMIPDDDSRAPEVPVTADSEGRALEIEEKCEEGEK